MSRTPINDNDFVNDPKLTKFLSEHDDGLRLHKAMQRYKGALGYLTWNVIHDVMYNRKVSGLNLVHGNTSSALVEQAKLACVWPSPGFQVWSTAVYKVHRVSRVYTNYLKELSNKSAVIDPVEFAVVSYRFLVNISSTRFGSFQHWEAALNRSGVQVPDNFCDRLLEQKREATEDRAMREKHTTRLKRIKFELLRSGAKV